jgi:hypothetical protein
MNGNAANDSSRTVSCPWPKGLADSFRCSKMAALLHVTLALSPDKEAKSNTIRQKKNLPAICM